MINVIPTPAVLTDHYPLSTIRFSNGSTHSFICTEPRSSQNDLYPTRNLPFQTSFWDTTNPNIKHLGWMNLIILLSFFAAKFAALGKIFWEQTGDKIAKLLPLRFIGIAIDGNGGIGDHFF